MKTKSTLHFFFSLCLLSLCSLIWGGNVLSAQTTVTSTFKDKNWTVGTDEPVWVKTGADATSLDKNGRGVQTTLSNIKSSGLSLTNTTVQNSGKIQSISINVAANGTGGSISSVKVGETAFTHEGSEKYNIPNSSNTEIEFTTTSAVAGDIVISFASTATSKSLYIKSISVTYVTAEGGAASQELSFENPSMEAYSDKIGSTLTNTLSGAKGNVTYDCSNESVATVAADGTVTIVGVGTTSIKATAAAATDNGTEYAETSKSYTLNVWPTSIAELKSITSTEAAFKAKLNNAYITYVPNTSNAYLQDATGAILIFKNGHGLTAGNCYTGEISGKTEKYNGLNEITDFDFTNATRTTKSDIVPEVVTMEALSKNFDQYESKYIKVTEVTAGGAVKATGNTCKLTQGGTAYDSPVLRAAATLTDGLRADATYPAIVVFPGYYITTQRTTLQLNLWSDDLVTFPVGTLRTPDVAFGAKSYEVPVKETIELPFTTNSKGEVTFTATPSKGITLKKTENGVSVTATATGTFTITANVAETATFAAGSTSTTLTVTPPAANLKPVVLYKKVTTTEDLIEGAQYVVVCESKNKALVAGTSNIHSATPANVTTADNKIASETIASGNVAVFTLGKVASGTNTYYTLKTNGMYANWSSDTNITLVAEPNANKTNWDIAFDSNGNAEITNVATLSESTKRGILYRASTSNVFKCYAIGNRGNTDYPDIQLYQKVGELKAHAVMKGYATYVTDFAYIMPNGLTGKIVYLDGDKLTTEDVYDAGKEVPELTPLLIRTADEVKTYYPVVLDKEVAKSEATDKNALEYRRTIDGEKYMTNTLNFADVESGCRYYKLSVDNNNQNPGFYYGAVDGAAFEMKNGASAYLTVAASSASPALLFDDNGTTGIENLTPAQNGLNQGSIYNLQGVRMNGKNLPKGLYIINGKKVVIK